uniref:NADP-dependent oxidoreductase domain-containing protein n=1 Tax=Norrisiella sphaerica TaxID=552664 RepID=A0A7S2QSU0_9EUKA
MIDTAQMYYNEKHIGHTLSKLFAEGTIRREDIFMTTKVAHPNFPGSHDKCPYVDDPSLSAYDGVSRDIDDCLRDLQMDYIDLVLIHWPGQVGNRDAKLGRQKRAEIWEALEDAYKAGKARTIGVSNFESYHMDQLSETWNVRPMVNQIECHPYLPQVELVREMQENGTQVMCYCPMGSGLLGVLEDPVINEMSIKHFVTPAQLVLSWHIQRGCIPVPKSTNKDRIESNLKCVQVKLDNEEISAITALAKNDARVCPNPKDIL